MDSKIWEIEESKLKIDKNKKLGEGLYGNVFFAQWTKDAEEVIDVAAKILPNHSASESELMTLKELSDKPHPNIIKFYGAVQSNNIIIVTELATRGSLYDYLKEQKRLQKPLEPDLIDKWALEAARAIQHLHNNDVMHRDVKSTNFLIMEDWTLKLCDFGLTKTDGSHTKTTAQGRGSYRWMAPEVFDNIVSKKSDIFSLGAVIWELLSREEPYHEYQKEHKLINAIMNKEEDLEIPAEWPNKIRNLIISCRRRDKDARPDIGSVIMELTTYQEGKTLSLY